MKNISSNTVLCIAALTFGIGSNIVTAGNDSEKKSRAGFNCFNAGPSNWTHCWRVKDFSDRAIAVSVYSEDGTAFLGTELLIHEDVYHGRPCPQDGGEWELNPAIPYYACHHFHTGHH